jgi:hypothetical protein
MCLYGEQQTLQALLAADVVMALVDCTHPASGAAAGGAAAVAPPSSEPLQQAACEALSGLAGFNAETRAKIFGLLVGPLNSDAAAPSACQALRTVAGSSPDCFLEIEKQGTALPRIVQLVATCGPESLHQPILLLAGMLRWCPLVLETAVKRSKAAEASRQSTGGPSAGSAPAPSKPGAAGPSDAAAKKPRAPGLDADLAQALISALTRGDLPTRVATAATCGFMARHDEYARGLLAKGGAVPLLFDVARTAPSDTPWWEEAMVAISVMVGEGWGRRRGLGGLGHRG